MLIVATGLLLWNIFASPTRIAFVNYQAISLGLISKANDNSFVTIKELPVEELDHASDYDMVFVNGMGLRITDEQRQSLATAADKGTPVLTTAATNPQNLIVSVDSVDQAFLKQYLNGGKTITVICYATCASILTERVFSPPSRAIRRHQCHHYYIIHLRTMTSTFRRSASMNHS